MLFTYYSCQLSCRLSGTQNTLNDEPHGVLEHYPGCSLLDIQVSREVVILTQSTSTLLHLKSKMRLHFYHNCYVFNTSFMYFQVNLQHGSSSFSFSLTFGSGSINSRKQAENGLQSRSSENGSVALWIEIAVILNWTVMDEGLAWTGMDCHGLVLTSMDQH